MCEVKLENDSQMFNSSLSTLAKVRINTTPGLQQVITPPTRTKWPNWSQDHNTGL